MADYDEEDLLALSTLKFVPLEPRPSRSARPATSSRGSRVDLLPRQDKLSLEDLSDQAKALQDSLYHTVAEHEKAVHADEGQLQNTRDALADAMLSLQDVLAKQASIRQFHIMRLLGAREDARQIQERLAYLSQGDDIQQAVEEAHAKDVATVKEIDALSAELQSQLKALAIQRADVKKRMRDRQQERHRKNKAHEDERRALQSELTVEQTEELIGEFRDMVANDEKEAKALEEGLFLFDELVTCMRQVEVDLAYALPADTAQAEHILTSAIDQLQNWLDEVTSKQWNLLIAIIGNELDALIAARTLLPAPRQPELNVNEGASSSHQGAPNLDFAET